LQVAKHGAGIPKASSRPSSTCPWFPRRDSVGGWPAITVARLKVGVLIRSVSVGANPFRVVHRLLRPAPRRHHAPCPPHRQALTLRPRLLRYLAQRRDSQAELQGPYISPESIRSSQNGAARTRVTSTGSSLERVSGSERVKRPTTAR
jgi:hypothetical protein